MRRIAAVLVVPVALVVLAGCSDAPAPSTAGSTPASTAPTTTPTSEASSSPSETPSSTPASPPSSAPTSSKSTTRTPVKLPEVLPLNTAIPRPAIVRERNAGKGNATIVSNAQTRTNFYTWVNYELQSPEDMAHTPAHHYDAGMFACKERTRGVTETTLVISIAQSREYTKNGGQAILKAAINALCPQHNAGFKTAFDRKVEEFAAAIGKTAKSVTAYDLGHFQKEVCLYLDQRGITNFFAYFSDAYYHKFKLTAGGSLRVEKLKSYLHQAVQTGCSTHLELLPPDIKAA